VGAGVTSGVSVEGNGFAEGRKGDVALPTATPLALDEGLRFALREGGKTVGSGVVTKVLARM